MKFHSAAEAIDSFNRNGHRKSVEVVETGVQLFWNSFTNYEQSTEHTSRYLNGLMSVMAYVSIDTPILFFTTTATLNGAKNMFDKYFLPWVYVTFERFHFPFRANVAFYSCLFLFWQQSTINISIFFMMYRIINAGDSFMLLVLSDNNRKIYW